MIESFSAPEPPLSRAGAEIWMDQSERIENTRAELLHSRVSEGATILVVDDSRTQLDWLVQVLSREGYRVVTAMDGRDAIRRVRSDPPDLVLLDMILPDMDGLEVLRIIKARGEDEFIPVILLSVKSDLDSRVSGLRIGADDFLAKPFADAEVLARSAAMLRIKGLQDQLRDAKAKLQLASITDGLTGLYNHRHFQDELRKEVNRAQRYSDPISLIMIDLDHFKRVNDRFGHPFGDQVLKETANLIRASLREPDISARYGGEEFAIILPKTHLTGALTVAERIWRGMATKAHHADPAKVSQNEEADSPEGALGEPRAKGKEHDVTVTASIGIAFYPSKDVTNAELLVKYADEALYRAKREGRNMICLFQARTYRYDAARR
jgi:two-component system cell cycle response regulator